MPLSAMDRQTLDEDGFLVLADFLSQETLANLRQRVDELFTAEGERAGSEFKQEPGCRRLANLVDKGDDFRAIIAVPHVLECVRHVLGPEIKLSSLNGRSVNPGGGTQPLHADMAAIADEQGYWVCNTIWMLDDYTSDNGALRVVPGSHRWRKLPSQGLDEHPEQLLVTGKAGTVVVLNAHVWHGGIANTTMGTRTSLHAFYCRRDKPQQQYQKGLLRPELQRSLPAEMRELLALDDALNDRLSAEVAVRSGFLK